MFSPVMYHLNREWMAIQLNVHSGETSQPHVVWDALGTRLPLATGPTFGFREDASIPRLENFGQKIQTPAIQKNTSVLDSKLDASNVVGMELL